MPQIFPMNWMLITILILILLTLIMMMTFFMKSVKSFNSNNLKLKKNFTFKW
uniref:ATP synthase F0 subunit 8 n=1 Tax=Haemaphysalis bispinosa TaxID=1340770 RepID=UPI0023AAC8A2|nr:ATP synthase F0 subunit 8 [Haemaphysalis bispinosa]WCD42297.1 ATP synthase F0 subunit 8 [Haemaphysalis bispinosa]